MVESASFPFLGGIARFVPNARLGGLTDGLDKLRDEFREATLDIDQLEIADQRRRIAEDASRRLQGDLDGFIRESVTTLRRKPPASPATCSRLSSPAKRLAVE